MTIESEREDERVAPIARPALTDGMGPSRASHLQREGQKPLRLLRRDWSRVEHTARVVICQLDECAPRRRIMGREFEARVSSATRALPEDSSTAVEARACLRHVFPRACRAGRRVRAQLLGSGGQS